MALALHKRWQLGLLILLQIGSSCLCVLATASRKELAAWDGLVSIVYCAFTIRLILHASLCDPFEVAQARRVLYRQLDGRLRINTLLRANVVEAS